MNIVITVLNEKKNALMLYEEYLALKYVEVSCCNRPVYDFYAIRPLW
jgi:hypothetical protein